MLSVVTPEAAGPDSAVESPNTNSRALEPLDRSLAPPARGREISVTLRPAPGENISALFRRLADTLQGATILNLFVFGAETAAFAGKDAMRRTFGKVEWPVTWVDGAPGDGGAISGIQAWAFTRDAVERIRLGGCVVGSVFQAGDARHCLVGGLVPDKRSLSRGHQTQQTLEQLQTALAAAGFSLGDTVRTWFYLADILSWYNEFNAARTEIYNGVKFRTGSLPASTGIGAGNDSGAALAVAARAMQPLTSRACAVETASPLQCPAPAYGSSFSRAMEITTAGTRHLLISGTASIAPGGKTMWQNDIQKQVELTMKVVQAILRSRGYSLSDLTRAVAYFKHATDAGAFASWCRASALTIPVVSAHCDICRHDLLFEIEADATKLI